MRKIFPLLLISNLLFTLTSAQDLAIGQWKQHLPFQKGIYVSQSDDQVFYATEHALLILDKVERSPQRITKVEGLSGVGVELVKYNRGNGVLLLAYSNGVIDLLSDEGNLTLLSVPESDILLGEKKISDVFMANDSIAYLSGNFGLTTLNLNTGLFPNTVKMPIGANAVRIFQEKIYVSTDGGVYTVDFNTGINIDDFSNWTWLSEEVDLPPTYNSEAMTVFNEKLYLDVNDSLYVFDGVSAQYVHHDDERGVHFLTSEGAHLLVGYGCTWPCLGKVFIFDENENFSPAGSGCVVVPFYAIEDSEGRIWYADAGSHYRVQEPGTGACGKIQVNSPATTNVYDLAVGNGQVWVATGGVDLTFSALFRSDGLFQLAEGTWRQYSRNTFSDPAGKSDFFDFLDVEIDPLTGKVYGAAMLDALVRLDPATGEFEVFNETNTELQLSVGDVDRSRVTGLAFDSENNLWMCNNNAPRPVVVMKPDGSTQSFSLSSCTPRNGIMEIEIDGLGYKWLMNLDATLGLTVFDEGDIDDLTDDQCRILNTSNSVLPTNEVNVLKVDRDGALWVGTKLGAVVFQCDPFNGECPGTRPFVEVDGFGANLLEDQDVQAIGVDGANRKWFGTGAGLFIMSPEGNEQIAHLTAENSPLFANSITSIDFDYETGEAYIGTTSGLISMRNEATGAEVFHSSNILVFPNPVRPDYEGPIAISGLAEDATVKITDVSGQLVFETEALGGQAIWNGRDYNDRKVNTGVYLVYATSQSSSNPDVEVTKILVVN